MAPKLYVLFEHASGYALFKVREFEEEGMFQAEVEKSVTDYAKFSSVVNLVKFDPFRSAQDALENINNLTEGLLPEHLLEFLQDCVKDKMILGVLDPKLATAISESLPGLKMKTGILIQELCRGIRFHVLKLIRQLTKEMDSKAQLGLGHAYSRTKVKFNVNRADNMIIQGIALLDQLDKDVNTFSMRIREWYSYHFPELVKVVPDNYLYAKTVHLIKNRKELDESKLEELEEVVGDAGKAQAILDASRSSMGMDISPIDLINIESFASRVIKLAEYRKGLVTYLQSKMTAVAPNLTSLLGETVAARLISHAGSLTNLAKFPASTVQILGAEKALFRALKTRGKTPKFGLLFHSTFIGRAGSANKGRISRFLANKCSIASRIDCFTDQPNGIVGDKLREQVEERLKFYDTGDVPRKNVEVMKEALNESSLFLQELEGSSKKKKKKKKNKKQDEEGADSSVLDVSNVQMDTETAVDEVTSKDKKKRKRKREEMKEEESPDVPDVVVTEEPPKKKNKKNKS